LDLADIEKIVEKQRIYFNTNVTKDVSFRLNQLKKLKTALIENEQLLHDAVKKDFKKSAFESFANEVFLVYEEIDIAVKNVKWWAKRKRVKTNLINFPAKSYRLPEPLGTTLVIGAWNYPYVTSLPPVISAIAAGNTVILKPSELANNASKAMYQIISEVFDQKYLAVVEGAVPETTTLLEQKFDKIFFTGSVPVGKIVYEAASKHLTPVTLELGGKNPTFITESCDLKRAVQRMIWAKYLNSGQICVAPDYVLVHHSIKDKFIEAAKKEIEASQFSFENGNYVQIITEKHTDRLSKLIDPEKVVHGGEFNISERYIAPTIMQDVSFDDPIMLDEIFGPILPVISYDNLDEVISKIKSRPKPLAMYIFTKDKQVKQKLLSEISSGTGAVNEALMQITNPNLPFGGVGSSGMSSYHGKFGFDAFTHYKSILDKPNWMETNLKYFPHTPRKLKLIKQMFRIS
jgi:aldehyde dehydrogenase (NAD+)